MDTSVVEALKAANIPTEWQETGPVLFLEADPSGSVPAVGPTTTVAFNDQRAQLTFKPLRELFTGSAKAPDLSGEPAREWQVFFSVVETTVLNFCALSGRVESDQEMERIYSQLRRRPDGRDQSKLFGYVRAACQLYLSVHDVSEAQFNALVGRLVKSARTFSEGHLSRNYLATLAKTMLEETNGLRARGGILRRRSR